MFSCIACKCRGTERGASQLPKTQPVGSVSASGRPGRTCKFQLRQYGVDEGRHRRSPGLDDKVSRFPVQRITDCVKIPQPQEGIRYLQERAVLVMAQTAKDLFRRRVQVNGLRALVQMVTVTPPQNRAAACRQDAGAVVREFIYQAFFDVAEGSFTFTLEKLSDRASYPLLYDLVRIDKLAVQPPCELPTYGGLARARHAHAGDSSRVFTHVCDRNGGARVDEAARFSPASKYLPTPNHPTGTGRQSAELLQNNGRDQPINEVAHRWSTSWE